MKMIFQSPKGTIYWGDSKKILEAGQLHDYEKKINLIFTSPPFPLNRKKAYGNLKGHDYVEWLSSFAEPLKNILTSDGSVVIELGNAWEPGNPTMSTLSLEALLEFKNRGGYHLCQEFICYNPARLPSPAQWVNVERIRVKDSFTRLWWLSPVPRPKADNKRVLQEYSRDMKDLLRTRKYNSGKRPSEHLIGASSFLRDHGGAIPSNVLTISNTSSRDPYLDYCKKKKIELHPARMPFQLAEFFIKFLTEENDIVFDPFAGSNTTGWISDKLDRKWISIEIKKAYAIASVARFQNSSSQTDFS